MAKQEDHHNHLRLNDQLSVERTNLSAERTFLAYTRTALTFAAAGGSLAYVVDSLAAMIFGWAGIAIGIGTFLFGAVRFRQLRRLVRHIADEEDEED
jgi:uncharacterized membrane protein YidH (DUF202 family)